MQHHGIKRIARVWAWQGLTLALLLPAGCGEADQPHRNSSDFEAALDVEAPYKDPQTDTLIEKAAGDSYDGAEVAINQTFSAGSTHRVRWRARPTAGRTAISLFSLFEEASPWSEITFETFGGSSDGSDAKFQTQYISDNPKRQHVVYHYSPNIFDGGLHTFEIHFRPFGNGSDAYVAWYVDGTKLREVNGGDANLLKNDLRIHAAVWKVFVSNNWGGRGNAPLADATAVTVAWIDRAVQNGNSWQTQETWSFNSESDLDSWRLSEWGFDSFDGQYVADNAQVRDGALRLMLTKAGTQADHCTLTDGVTYGLENTKSGRFMDATNKGSTRGTTLQQWGTEANGAHRQFTAIDRGSSWSFERVGTDLLLDVKGGTSATGNGPALHLWNDLGASNQRFEIEYGQNGGCELRPSHASGKCIGVRGGSTKNGAKAVQWACNDSADQEWHFIAK